jgi:glycosyltransferase involved in cell wall biosynthesis
MLGVGDSRPLASVLVPAFREADTIASTIERVAAVLVTLTRYDWEIVVVDDGSPDDTTGQVLLAAQRVPVPVRLVRHVVNQGLGGALRTGFAATAGGVVIVLDADLSYDESHILALLDAWERTRAQVVVASPYMAGGRSTGVPTVLERRSRTANKILSGAALDDIKTLTGMVRAYDGPFVRGLSLKAVDVDINVEILYKTQLLRGSIVEIPAHLNWSDLQHRATRNPVLSSRGRWNTAKSLVLTYLFRPFWFPLVPALLFAVFGVVVLATGAISWGMAGSAALVLAVMLAVTSLSMLQAKRYFEELYFMGARASGGQLGPFAHPWTEPSLGAPGAAAAPEVAAEFGQAAQAPENTETSA